MRALALVCLVVVIALVSARPAALPTKVLVSFDLKSTCLGSLLKKEPKFRFSYRKALGNQLFSSSTGYLCLENFRTEITPHAFAYQAYGVLLFRRNDMCLRELTSLF